MFFFTIVITTKNRVQLLRRAFESAQKQTLQAEIVIIDDGSEDETQEYVNSLGNQVIYIRNSHSLGQAKTVNKGVEKATGKWIKLLDDDDWLTPNCLAEMYQTIIKHDRAVICSCQAINIKNNGDIINQTIRRGNSEICYVKQSDIHYGMFQEILPVGTPTQVAFQREIFLQTNGWNSNFDGFGNDTDSWLRMLKYGDLLLINQVLGYRTISASGYSQKHNIQQRIKYQLILKQKMLNLMPSEYKNDCSLKHIENFVKYSHSLC